MLILMLTRRLQVLIDEERFRRLEAESARREVPVSVLVRAAIDEAFPSGGGSRAAAAVQILAAHPMPVPEPDELRAELDTARSRRS